ncbi:MAG: hypothetical protein FJ316_03090 [SAR202 cluster bacterium]|nr:hypothetical protein [SAR202 cluster bacterium]
MKRRLATYLPLGVLAVGLALGLFATMMALGNRGSQPVAEATFAASPTVASNSLGYTTFVSGRKSEYRISGTVSGETITTADTITVTFPTGTTVPSSFSSTCNCISVGDGGNTPDPWATTVTVSGQAVTITVPALIENEASAGTANNTLEVGDTFLIVFGGELSAFVADAGITTLDLNTVSQGFLARKTTNTLTIQHNSLSAVTSANFTVQRTEVVASPRTAGDLAEYSFTFTVTGNLPANTGEIRLTFDKDVQIPASINRSNVMMQANVLSGVPGGDGSDLISTTGANQVVPLAFDPTTEIDTTDPERKILILKVPDMNTGTSTESRGVGAQGIGAYTGTGFSSSLPRTTVTVTFTTGAGLVNAKFEDLTSGFSISAKASAGSTTELVDSGASHNTIIQRRIFVSTTDGERGSKLTITGKGFRTGTTVTIWLDDPGGTPDNIREATESDLVTVTAASDNTFTATFTVTNPPFKPGAKNYLAAIDGRGNVAPYSQVTAAKYELRGGVTVTPTTLKVGDTMTIQLKDFDASVNVASTTALSGYTAKPYFRLGGVDLDLSSSSGTTTNTQGEATFTATVPNRVPLGVQSLETQFACCAGGAGSSTTIRRFNLTIGGAVLILTPEKVVPNQTLNIVGNDFTTSDIATGVTINAAASGSCTQAGNITIQGIAIATSKINEGAKIDVAAGGNWSASLLIPVNSTTTTPGTYDLKVTDCMGREGVAKLTIAPRTITLTPKEGQVGTPVNIAGTGFPAKNDRTNAVVTSVTVTYDASGGNTSSVSIQPDASGNIAGTLNVPTNAIIPSTNTVKTEFTAKDDSTVVVNTVTHDVPRAGLSISPNTGVPGTKVTAKIEGAKAFTTITSALIGANLDVKPAPTPFTNGIGNVTFDFIVPQMEVGVQNLEIKIGSTTSSAAFTVQAATAVTPPSSSSVGDALSKPLGSNLERAFHFNNQTKTWSFFDPRPEFGAANSLANVTSGQVYWIKIGNDTTITFCGHSSTSLYKGWNQVPC